MFTTPVGTIGEWEWAGEWAGAGIHGGDPDGDGDGIAGMDPDGDGDGVGITGMAQAGVGDTLTMATAEHTVMDILTTIREEEVVLTITEIDQALTVAETILLQADMAQQVET
jgi:hypothetical protein